MQVNQLQALCESWQPRQSSESVEIPWESEDSECTYDDCMFPEDE